MADFKVQFQQEIEDLISQLETKTSVEIVPVLLDRSSYYCVERLLLALIVWVIYLSIFFINPNWLPVWEVYFVGALLFYTIYVSSSLGPVFRFIFPKRLYQSRVSSRAKEIFFEEEFFATSERSALLILVSRFEHTVYIFADKGLSLKLGDSLWAELGKRLAADFCKKLPGKSFIAALKDLAPQLESYFPIGDKNNPNELKNHLRVKFQSKN